MKKRLLVIIDMQPPRNYTGFVTAGFVTAEKIETQCEIIRQILLARQKEWPIIILEYATYAPTANNIMAALHGYPYQIFRKKHWDGGESEVVDAIEDFKRTFRRRKFHRIKHLRFMGVNTHACVLETVNGCARLMPQKIMEVWMSGCNDFSHSDIPSFDQKNVVALTREVA